MSVRKKRPTMMNRMIVGNLVHRPIRSLISIVAVALEVTMILLIVGLCLGMMQDTRTRTAGIGADILVRPPGSSFIQRFSGAPMSVKIEGVLAKLAPREERGSGCHSGCHCGSLEIIAGIDLPTYESLSVRISLSFGRPLPRPLRRPGGRSFRQIQAR